MNQNNSMKTRNLKGYYSYFSYSKGRKGYSGVAIYTKEKPLKIENGIGIKEFDDEGRLLVLYFKKFVMITGYFPNAGQGPERLKYKLEFYDAFLKFINKLKDDGQNVIFCGDVNTAHNAIDLARRPRPSRPSRPSRQFLAAQQAQQAQQAMLAAQQALLAQQQQQAERSPRPSEPRDADERRSAAGSATQQLPDGQRRLNPGHPASVFSVAAAMSASTQAVPRIRIAAELIRPEPFAAPPGVLRGPICGPRRSMKKAIEAAATPSVAAVGSTGPTRGSYSGRRVERVREIATSPRRDLLSSAASQSDLKRASVLSPRRGRYAAVRRGVALPRRRLSGAGHPVHGGSAASTSSVRSGLAAPRQRATTAPNDTRRRRSAGRLRRWRARPDSP